jgi:hypothetical protein
MRVAAKPKHPIRVTLDGTVVNGSGLNGAGRPRGVIPLKDDRREHYVEVEMSQGGSD